MVNSGLLVGKGQLLALVLAAVVLSGCASKQDKAIDQAKAQAAQTGLAQQVVSVDKNGTTTTTVVQPPAKGQTNAAITTVVTPPAPGTQAAAAGQRKHPSGHAADDQNRPEHRREAQPRRGQIYGRNRGSCCGRRQ